MNETPQTGSPICCCAPAAPAEKPADACPCFWPIALLAVSFLLLVGWQTYAGVQQRRLVKQQVQQRHEMEMQSQRVQADLQRLIASVSRMAKYDLEAKVLAEKYGIQPAK